MGIRHIARDLNQLRTNFEKFASVYHIKNMGKVYKIIPIPILPYHNFITQSTDKNKGYFRKNKYTRYRSNNQ